MTIGGWIRADYGTGDRYDEADGEDNLGVSQAALLGKWVKENVEAILVVGGTNLTADDDPDDGDIGIKDAFIVWREMGGSRLTLSAGVQPLLFGLKANGFPGDRSLQPSIEFGGAGGFAVSQQAGPSVILSYQPRDVVGFRFGAFDTSESTAEYFAMSGLGRIDGSSISKNYFAEVELGRREKGLYGSVGYAARYVGAEIDSSEPILSAGIGFRGARFDLSLEAQQLDQALTRTLDDELYSIAELTIYPTDTVRLYFDYGSADELDVETLRAGVKVSILENFLFVAEYSQDQFGLTDIDVDSVDLRLEFSYWT